MADQRAGGIAWTDRTWNPIRGCSRKSPGCIVCYAEIMAGRFSGPGMAYEGLVRQTNQGPRWTGEVAFIEGHLEDPLSWRKPSRVFVNSMSDLFHEKLRDDEIDRIFAVMALAPRHTFQVLTKRPERALQYLTGSDVRARIAHAIECIVRGPLVRSPKRFDGALANVVLWDEREEARDGEPVWKMVGIPDRMWPLPNVWLGVSVESQQYADERIPLLLQTPAAVRWVSYEPALEPVDFSGWLWGRDVPCNECPKDIDCGCGFQTRKWLGEPGIDWIVVGGESGSEARAFDIAWARATMAQCRAAGVPVFVKQLGSNVWYDGIQPAGAWWPGSVQKTIAAGPPSQGFSVRLLHPRGEDPAEWPEDLRVREFPAQAVPA